MFSCLSSLSLGDAPDRARLQANSDRTFLSLSKSSITAITSPSKASFLETPFGVACLILTSKSQDKVATASFRTIIQSAIQSVVKESSHDTWDDDGCEALYGRAGLLYGLLRLRKNELVSARDIELVVSSIMTRGRFGASVYRDSIPSQQQSPALMWSWHGKRYLGAAHGVAGILQTVLACPLDLLNPYIPDILDTVEWLMDCQDEEGNWPTKAPRHGKVSGDEKNELVQWCHGAIGIVMLLSTVLKLSSQNLQEFRLPVHLLNKATVSIRKGASLVYRHGFLRKGVGLCHGVGGSIYALLSTSDALALVPGDSDHKHNSLYYFQRAVHLAYLSTSYEKLTEDGEMGVPDRPGSLYEGLAGMCCAWGEIARRTAAIDVEGKAGSEHSNPQPLSIASGFPGYDDL
ncbi:lanthionine synthetase C-like protein [Desarmillaria tabescens]|uniref:Lanthionine synthetase C-like protein n=1 Tax=Armillaria tabescens TaxID=1929756 RepID=A0AA39JWV7_ARMTA|nr:lanthionine synthetase C-like protein [Desarmillaria tabescens]KAK0450411.1 lanthionine synthetase C-like protein [Desarmillaria tabescens]